MKRRSMLALVAMGALALFIAACTEEVIKEVPVEKEVVVLKEVVKEVPVEKIVEKVVVKEVPVEKIVEKEVIKEVEVEKEVVKRVVREVVATAMPLSGGLAVEQAKYGGTAIVTAQSSIKTLDPSFSDTAVTLSVGMHMFENIGAWDKSYVANLNIPSRMDISSDGLEYTFTLRPNLFFSTGESMTAEDVVVSVLTRWLPKQQGGKLLQRFALDPDDFIKVVDDNTFVIVLKEPFGQIMEGFAMPGGSGGVVFPKEIGALAIGKDVGEENIIGSGPYRVKKWEVGNKVVLERNPFYVPRSDPGNYAAGAQIAYLDEVTWIEIPAEETKIAGLKTGEWDIVDDPSLDAFTALKDYPGVKVAISKPGRMSHANFNFLKSPTDNPLFRQAVVQAVDAKAHMAGLGDPALWELCASIFYCGHPQESKASSEFYNQNNPTLAMQTLAEMGYDGEEFFLMNPNDYGTITPLGPVFKSQLEDIGINVNMPGMDWASVATRFSDYTNNTWNSFTSWCSFSFSRNPLFNCMIGQNDYKKYDSQEIVDLREKYSRATTPEDIAKYRDALQDVYYKDNPTVNFGGFFSIVPFSDRMQNLTVRIYPILTNTYVKE